jgi:hypothetical protein
VTPAAVAVISAHVAREAQRGAGRGGAAAAC